MEAGFNVYAPTVFTVDGLDLSGLWPGLETRAGGTGNDFIGTLSNVTSTTPMDALDLILQDSDNTAFGGSDPSFGDIDLSDFETAILLFYNPRLDASNPNRAFSLDRVDLTITSLTLQPVPLPAGLPMLLAGLGALVVLRRSRKEKVA
ncbi:VPLPA-CTERM sorting domain-containing protein [Tateyamaria armeniaca]|uniref:VPLPA-CTERM sorting domain-containing protein n=1 Tax=Tateyamaria armeniaca TaxID=2518930 RepID=A0ABW8UZW2_9RHOB